jgi:hypothetical protein
MIDVNINTQFRQCFMTDSGKFVLGYLLKESGFFDADITNPEQIAIQNFIKIILKNCLIVDTEFKIPEYVNKLFELDASEPRRAVANNSQL